MEMVQIWSLSHWSVFVSFDVCFFYKRDERECLFCRCRVELLAAETEVAKLHISIHFQSQSTHSRQKSRKTSTLFWHHHHHRAAVLRSSAVWRRHMAAVEFVA